MLAAAGMIQPSVQSRQRAGQAESIARWGALLQGGSVIEDAERAGCRAAEHDRGFDEVALNEVDPDLA